MTDNFKKVKFDSFNILTLAKALLYFLIYFFKNIDESVRCATSNTLYTLEVKLICKNTV